MSGNGQFTYQRARIRRIQHGGRWRMAGGYQWHLSPSAILRSWRGYIPPFSHREWRPEMNEMAPMAVSLARPPHYAALGLRIAPLNNILWQKYKILSSMLMNCKVKTPVALPMVTDKFETQEFTAQLSKRRTAGFTSTCRVSRIGAGRMGNAKVSSWMKRGLVGTVNYLEDSINGVVVTWVVAIE
ncbi:hypothetical protein BDZ97DRAFT_1763772 [Flammula alnicola]|nr:hypothetical protein BDZ97DRAFT_1763772 [Flammula alnicola]